MRRKFNNILQEHLVEAKNSFYLETGGIFDAYAGYDNLGYLNTGGRKPFWKRIDLTLEKFDRGEANLKPRRKLPAPPTSGDRHSGHRR